MYHSLIIQCTWTGYRLLPLIGIATDWNNHTEESNTVSDIIILVYQENGIGGWGLGGLELTPQRGSAELSGGSAISCGGQTPLSPRQIQPC